MGQGIGVRHRCSPYNSLNAAQSLQDSSDGNESGLVSFLSRANYGYKDKFFVTGVLRYDGSSKSPRAQVGAVPWAVGVVAFDPGGVPARRAVLGPAPAGRLGASGNSGIKPYQSLPTTWWGHRRRVSL